MGRFIWKLLNFLVFCGMAALASGEKQGRSDTLCAHRSTSRMIANAGNFGQQHPGSAAVSAPPSHHCNGMIAICGSGADLSRRLPHGGTPQRHMESSIRRLYARVNAARSHERILPLAGAAARSAALQKLVVFHALILGSDPFSLVLKTLN
ncbi:MAG: hypothetical protein AB7E73_06105 [Burkholderiales bacterium]